MDRSIGGVAPRSARAPLTVSIVQSLCFLSPHRMITFLGLENCEPLSNGSENGARTGTATALALAALAAAPLRTRIFSAQMVGIPHTFHAVFTVFG